MSFTAMQLLLVGPWTALGGGWSLERTRPGTQQGQSCFWEEVEVRDEGWSRVRSTFYWKHLPLVFVSS